MWVSESRLVKKSKVGESSHIFAVRVCWGDSKSLVSSLEARFFYVKSSRNTMVCIHTSDGDWDWIALKRLQSFGKSRDWIVTVLVADLFNRCNRSELKIGQFFSLNLLFFFFAQMVPYKKTKKYHHWKKTKTLITHPHALHPTDTNTRPSEGDMKFCCILYLAS